MKEECDRWWLLFGIFSRLAFWPRFYSGLLTQNTVQGDTVVIMPGHMTNPFDFYYDNVTDKTRELGLSRADDLISVMSEKEKGKIFITFTDDLNAADPSGQAIQWMKDNAHFAGYQSGVYVFVVV